jgi:hypothetical protein
MCMLQHLTPCDLGVCNAEPVACVSGTSAGGVAQRQCSHTCSRPRSTGPLPDRYGNTGLSKRHLLPGRVLQLALTVSFSALLRAAPRELLCAALRNSCPAPLRTAHVQHKHRHPPRYCGLFVLYTLHTAKAWSVLRPWCGPPTLSGNVVQGADL